MFVQSLSLGHLSNRYALCRCSGGGSYWHSPCVHCGSGRGNSGCVVVEDAGVLNLQVDAALKAHAIFCLGVVMLFPALTANVGRHCD